MTIVRNGDIANSIQIAKTKEAIAALPMSTLAEATIKQSQCFALLCKAVVLTIVIGSYSTIVLKYPHNIISLIIFGCSTISSVAGFAFSAIAGPLLLHMLSEPVMAVRIMLIASISVQAYSVWALRRFIIIREVLPYFMGGVTTAVPGVYLLLNAPTRIYLLALGGLLTAYGMYSFLRPSVSLKNNSLAGRALVGALGGITGATAAFPGAFITIWCAAQGWEKRRQRAIYQPFILGMQVLILSILAAFKPHMMLRPDLLLYSIPALIGSYLGFSAFKLLSTEQFNKVVSVFLLISGIAISLKVL
jgi:uncharacterized membrane protein YfcA